MFYLILAIISVIVTLACSFWIIILSKKLKKTQASLRELLKESEQQTEKIPTDGKIYFKIDSEFNITAINESGAKQLGYNPDEIINNPVFSSIVEDTSAQRELLEATLNQMRKAPQTINLQIILQKNDSSKQLMYCRMRPILNEILECEGISFYCQDVSQASEWKQNLTNFQKTDIFTNTLNEVALLHRFAHDFQLAKRYNREFSCVVIELKDIYEFISKGIDFETADKMLKSVGQVCSDNLPKNSAIGRVDKTKFFMFMNKTPRSEAKKTAEKIMISAVEAIKSLRVDEYNAQMMVVTYTNRRNFNDTYDAMLSRVRRHISSALNKKIYGLVSSDERGILIKKTEETE